MAIASTFTPQQLNNAAQSLKRKSSNAPSVASTQQPKQLPSARDANGTVSAFANIGNGTTPFNPFGNRAPLAGNVGLIPPTFQPFLPVEQGVKQTTTSPIQDPVISNFGGAGNVDEAIKRLLNTDVMGLFTEDAARQAGQAVANTNARMARGGFGASGANAALSSDLARTAALDALKQGLGVQTSMLGAGIQGAQEQQRLSNEQTALDAGLALLAQELGVSVDELRNVGKGSVTAAKPRTETQAAQGPSLFQQRFRDLQQQGIAVQAVQNPDGSVTLQYRDPSTGQIITETY